MVRVALINLAIAAIAAPAALAAPTWGGEHGNAWWRQNQGEVSNDQWKKWWSETYGQWQSKWQRPTGTVTYVFPHTTITRTYGELPSSLILPSSSAAEVTFTSAPEATVTSAPEESATSAPDASITSAPEASATSEAPAPTEPESSVSTEPTVTSASEAPASSAPTSSEAPQPTEAPAPSSSESASEPVFTFSASRPGAPSPTATPAPSSTIKVTTSAPAPTSSAAAPGGTLGTNQQMWLDEHNKVRASHKAQDLTWSTELEAAAQQWANKCIWEHSGGQVGAFGENLFLGSGNGYTPADAVQDWAAEAKDYNAASPQYSHFTQVVWKATTELGCAIAQCDNIMEGWGSSSLMVCEYKKPGNVIGQFAENVSA